MRSAQRELLELRAVAWVRVPGAADGPAIWLCDASEAGLDEPGLRACARSRSAAATAGFSSRSYRHPYALLATHDQPVGVDIERVEALDRQFLESICTAEERAALPDEVDSEYVTSLWCSKEALSKALGDALRYDPRRLPSPIGWTDGRAGPWRAAALLAPEGHTAWACWRSIAG